MLHVLRVPLHTHTMCLRPCALEREAKLQKQFRPEYFARNVHQRCQRRPVLVIVLIWYAMSSGCSFPKDRTCCTSVVYVRSVTVRQSRPGICASVHRLIRELHRIGKALLKSAVNRANVRNF